MFSKRTLAQNFVASAFVKSEKPTITKKKNGKKFETENPWQEEVKENGELFYVEEDKDVDGSNGSKTDSRNLRNSGKLDADHNLHGVSRENNISANRINYNKNSSDNIHYERSQALSSETVSNKDAYRDYRRKIQRDYSPHKNIPNDSFKLHSEQIVSDLKNVTIFVKAASTYGRKGTTSLLESMLGIISIKDDRFQKQYRYSQSDQLVVNVLLPNGPAAKSEAVDLGDILLALNDVAVYKSNVEQVLSRVPHTMELKMTFLCQRSTVSTEPTTEEDLELERELLEQIQHQPSMVQLLKPSAVDTVVTSVGPYHAIFYLTLNVNSETARGEEDVLYSYPASDNPSTRKLKSVRGIFTTLADVSSDAFNSKVRSSTLVVDEELVHCAYCHQGSEVFVICVPSSIYPLPHLHKIVTNAVRLLNVMFGSVTLAFKAENVSRLDHLFYLLFSTNNWTGATSQLAEGFLPSPVSGTPMLVLEEELTADIDMALAELEAADFDDGFHNQSFSRRLYTILGSCLFYKGYLVGNHLPDEDLKDVSIFCKSYCLLGKLRVGQLVIWRRVFPQRRKSDSVTKSLGFCETNGNYFYLIVGLHYSLLCILLEAGGCSVPYADKRGPDPLYVNRARATILHLDSLSVPGGIEEHLSKPAVPTLSSADSLSKKPPTFLFGSSHHKPPSGSGQSQPTIQQQQGGIKFPFLSASKKSNKSGTDSGPSSAPNMSSTPASPSSMHRIGSQKSLASQGSVDSGGSGSKVVRSLASGFAMGDVRSSHPSVSPEVTRLTSGVENTLFHFLQFDSTNGILMTPTDQDLACLDGPFHRCVVDNFRRSVLLLHERLVETGVKDQSQKIYEEGVLFHCQLTNILPEGNKKATPHVQYWVVGRSAVIQQRRSEFYVCFHDSAQEDMNELAFRIGFGIVT